MIFTQDNIDIYFSLPCLHGCQFVINDRWHLFFFIYQNQLLPRSWSKFLKITRTVRTLMEQNTMKHNATISILPVCYKVITYNYIFIMLYIRCLRASPSLRFLYYYYHQVNIINYNMYRYCWYETMKDNRNNWRLSLSC